MIHGEEMLGPFVNIVNHLKKLIRELREILGQFLLFSLLDLLLFLGNLVALHELVLVVLEDDRVAGEAELISLLILLLVFDGVLGELKDHRQFFDAFLFVVHEEVDDSGALVGLLRLVGNVRAFGHYFPVVLLALFYWDQFLQLVAFGECRRDCVQKQ